jgi:hypothetical protein
MIDPAKIHVCLHEAAHATAMFCLGIEIMGLHCCASGTDGCCFGRTSDRSPLERIVIANAGSIGESFAGQIKRPTMKPAEVGTVSDTNRVELAVVEVTTESQEVQFLQHIGAILSARLCVENGDAIESLAEVLAERLTLYGPEVNDFLERAGVKRVDLREIDDAHIRFKGRLFGVTRDAVEVFKESLKR